MAPNLAAYKARPLNSVWATPPYLHNGSVANIDQLLWPAKQRARSFTLGAVDYDPQLLGFPVDSNTEGFLFQSVDAEGQVIPGNSSQGHSGPRFTETKDDNGQWQVFSSEQRAALLEYLKTVH